MFNVVILVCRSYIGKQLRKNHREERLLPEVDQQRRLN